jgi:hypothetical protein
MPNARVRANARQRLLIRLPDLPDQKQRQETAVITELSHAAGYVALLPNLPRWVFLKPVGSLSP